MCHAANDCPYVVDRVFWLCLDVEVVFAFFSFPLAFLPHVGTSICNEKINLNYEKSIYRTFCI